MQIRILSREKFHILVNFTFSSMYDIRYINIIYEYNYKYK